MKEAIVAKGPVVTIQNIPTPKPNADQVLIRVIYSGSNPKDWKLPCMIPPHNSGDDIAGFVEEVGENVLEFRKGDRVAAFHEMTKPNGSFAEYAIAPAHTTFHLPDTTTFEEASTIPLAAMTAAVGLYAKLGLPAPWSPTLTPIPLIVYGGSGAVGAFVIKLAQASNIHPIIAVAGKGEKFVEGLIDRTKGDAIVDYRNGDEAVVKGIRDALKGKEVHYAYDAVSEKGSFQNISKVLAKEGSKITLVLPGIVHNGDIYKGTDGEAAAKEAGIKTGGREFGLAYFRLFTRGLQDGWFTGHPYDVIPGGLNGVEKGLADLQNGLASAKKFIFHVAETRLYTAEANPYIKRNSGTIETVTKHIEIVE